MSNEIANRIIGKTVEIGSGWYNYLNKDEGIENKARERAVICGGCEHNTEAVHLKLIPDDNKEIEGHLCKLCGCPLSMKIRSIKTNCKINKW